MLVLLYTKIFLLQKEEDPLLVQEDHLLLVKADGCPLVQEEGPRLAQVEETKPFVLLLIITPKSPKTEGSKTQSRFPCEAI